MNVVELNGRKCLTQPIPSDGNCLFGAVVHQIFQKIVPSSEHRELTRALRELVVQYISDNLSNPSLSELILLRVEHEFPQLKTLNDDAETLRKFLRVLYRDGVWGASESLLALAMYFECDIVLHREHGFTTTVENDDGTATVRPKIVLVYRGPRNNWDHYESFLSFIDESHLLGDCDIHTTPKSPDWWSSVSHNSGNCIVLNTEPDGNCLFSSLAHQLFGTEIGSTQHATNIALLRRQAVSHLQINIHMHRYHSILSDRLLDFPQFSAMNIDQNIQLLLKHLSQPNVWGGTECILAISDIYGCAVRTIWENSGTSTIVSIRNAGLSPITIVYRRGVNGWNHYDSFLCVTRHNIQNDSTSSINGNVSQSIDLISTMDMPPPTINTFAISSQNLTSSLRMPLSISEHVTEWPKLRIGTWNIRGCNQREKRRNMDNYLSIHGFDIIAIQETKLNRRTCDTPHYKWILGPDNDGSTTARGLAFLIHVTMVDHIRKTIPVSHNIFACEVAHDGQAVIIVNVHIPQNTNGTSEFQLLKTLVSTVGPAPVIVLGDFNAHIGNKDLTTSDRQFIGPNLYHDICNDNGEELKNLLQFGKFSIKNTWCSSPSVNTTWCNTNLSSQIDHILCNSTSIKFRHTFGTWIHLVSTDHKLISTDIYLPKGTTVRPAKRSGSHFPSSSAKRSRAFNSTTQWDVKLLADTKFRIKYQDELANGSRALLSTETEPNATKTSSDSNVLWTKVAELIKQTASNTIPTQTTSLSPNRLAARNSFRTERARLLNDPSNVAIQRRVQTAKHRMEELHQLHLDKQCKQFFDDIDKVHPQRRVSMTYRYLKQFRRSKVTRSSPNISISQWETELKQFCNGARPHNIPENDHCPMDQPPSLTEILAAINRMHNNTAPGQDRLNIELIKYGPPELLELIHIVTSRVWTTNVVPPEWLNTTQVPLPKVRTPKSVDDYRRIALSNTVYKIYASILRQRLMRTIPEIPYYQAGFTHNRSTDDHIFTLRRVTEERWRKGLPTYIISIDLKKAFDMINIKQIVNILLQYGAPAYLINRIISTILVERTSIRWFGRRTKVFHKNKGIKQGCPISPYLFIIVMNYAIQRACDRLGIDTNLATFRLPFILAYADDIVVLTDSIQAASDVIRELEVELLNIGLSINAPKCSVLLRDPAQVAPPLDDTVLINTTHMPVVSTMRYLGIYISSDLDRRSTVAQRIKVAYRTLHMMLPFVREHRLPFASLVRIYHTVILPEVMYGLKVATITKQNRNSLNNMERYIITKLRDLARDPPLPNTPMVLLRGRTIDRKCRVHRLKYWGHVMRRPPNHILRQSYLYKIPGKLKHGRPCYTWHNSLDRAIRRSRVRDWNLHIHDRKAHNKLCEEIYLPSDTDDSN